MRAQDYEPAERKSLRKSLALPTGLDRHLGGARRVLHLRKSGTRRQALLERALELAPGHPGRALSSSAKRWPGLDQLEQAEQHLRFAVAADQCCCVRITSRRVLIAPWRAARRGSELSVAPSRSTGHCRSSHANLALGIGPTGTRGRRAAAAAREALAVIGGIRDGCSGGTNLSLLDLIASALDDAGETEDALGLSKAKVHSRNESRRASWAIYTARRACDWDFAARPGAAGLQRSERPRTR